MSADFHGGNMSVVGADTGFDLAAPRGAPDEIFHRLESLPASSYVWCLVILLSLGGFVEMYDLFFTGYIAPA
jgi:MFS transporter, putative metabolite:H+ symporter